MAVSYAANVVRLTSIHIDTFVEDGCRHFMATGSGDLGLATSAIDLKSLLQKLPLAVPNLMEANKIWPKPKTQ